MVGIFLEIQNLSLKFQKDHWRGAFDFWCPACHQCLLKTLQQVVLLQFC